MKKYTIRLITYVGTVISDTSIKFEAKDILAAQQKYMDYVKETAEYRVKAAGTTVIELRQPEKRVLTFCTLSSHHDMNFLTGANKCYKNK